MEGRNPVAELGALLASKGVPPFLVASNISDPSYTSVRLWKENGCILVETRCNDEESNELTYVYRYDQSTTLQRIDMTVADRSSVVWDRQQEIMRLGAAVKARSGESVHTA